MNGTVVSGKGRARNFVSNASEELTEAAKFTPYAGDVEPQRTAGCNVPAFVDYLRDW